MRPVIVCVAITGSLPSKYAAFGNGAALCNAIFRATGKRIRSLPVRLDA